VKITRDQALAVTHFCRTHKVKYASAATYPNTQAAAEKKQVRSTNGMLLHFPRDPNTRWQRENPRAYVLWYGEPLENIIEALAFIKMTTRKEELIVLRCKHASKAAEAVEATITGGRDGVFVDDVVSDEPVTQCVIDERALAERIIDAYERET
jgi:hypothetical protein